MGTVEALARMPLFAGLESESLEELKQVAQPRRTSAEEIVVRQGEPGDWVYLIVSGQLEVTVEDGGGRRTLATMTSGELFGEISAVDGQPRSATVTALAPSDLLAIDRFSFLRLLRSRPRFGIRVMALMAQRLRRHSLQRAEGGARSATPSAIAP